MSGKKRMKDGQGSAVSRESAIGAIRAGSNATGGSEGSRGRAVGVIGGGKTGKAVADIASGSELLAVNREGWGILGGEKRPATMPLSDEERRAYKMALILVCVETQTMQGMLLRTGEDVKRVFGGGWAVVEKRILRDIGARGTTAMETNAASKMLLRELAESPEAVDPEYARDTIRTVRERWGAEVREACGCWGKDGRSEVGGQRSEVGGQRSEVGGQRSEVGAVRGGPGEKTVGGEGGVTHFTYMPGEIASELCGKAVDGVSYFSGNIDEVDCVECLRLVARLGEGK